jgi:7,8-dihydro-6-hydroxymethylpterin-pyrophosphokinase
MELSLEVMTMGLAVANDRYRNAVARGNPVQAERLLRQVDEIEARIKRYLDQHRAQRGGDGEAGAGDVVGVGVREE